MNARKCGLAFGSVLSVVALAYFTHNTNPTQPKNPSVMIGAYQGLPWMLEIVDETTTTTTTTTTTEPPPVVVETPKQVTPVYVAPVPVAPVVTTANAYDVLSCIRSHESANVSPTPWYAYNPSGPYYGAYQYVQGTWNNAAAAAGRPDLVGKPPMEPYVSAADQDYVTRIYHDMVGDGPWGNRC